MVIENNFNHCNCDHSRLCGIVDLNGIPYLLGSYLNKNTFRQINRSDIRSEVIIDNSEAMRAIININIDDIGRRASDGYPSVVGNNSKMKRVLKMLSDYSKLYGKDLQVIRDGIVVRVNYQVENLRTGQVIRTMSEDFRIGNRNLFIDINPEDINDNAIIVNFSDVMISTIDQFTHGLDQMQFRVTKVQLFYEMVKPRSSNPIVHKCDGHHHLLPSTYEPVDRDLYGYFNAPRHQYIDYPFNGHHCGNGPLVPDDWAICNHFYHFDRNSADICLHTQDINDPRYETQLISALDVGINRSFVVNPGARIIFKFNIWKNDLTLINNGYDVAKALQVPFIDNSHDYDDPHHGCDCHPPMDINYESTIRMIHEMQCIINRQNGVINTIIQNINDLNETVKSLIPPVSDGTEDGDNSEDIDIPGSSDSDVGDDGNKDDIGDQPVVDGNPEGPETPSPSLPDASDDTDASSKVEDAEAPEHTGEVS